MSNLRGAVSLYKVVLTFKVESMDKTISVNIEINAFQQYFLMVRFVSHFNEMDFWFVGRRSYVYTA